MHNNVGQCVNTEHPTPMIGRRSAIARTHCIIGGYCVNAKTHYFGGARRTSGSAYIMPVISVNFLKYRIIDFVFSGADHQTHAATRAVTTEYYLPTPILVVIWLIRTWRSAVYYHLHMNELKNFVLVSMMIYSNFIFLCHNKTMKKNIKTFQQSR